MVADSASQLSGLSKCVSLGEYPGPKYITCTTTDILSETSIIPNLFTIACHSEEDL